MKFDRDNNNYEKCIPQQPVTLTPGFIKKWYEINPDTNAFTDAEKLKLETITDGKDGLDGKDGKDGIDGINGTDGTNGKDGKEGQQGIPGNEGPKGLQGDKGIPGTNTPAPGPTGPKGAKGDKGDRGTNGTDGIIGKDGTDGAGGLKGDKGDQGDRGLPGPQGVKGSTGSDGPRGVSGKDGANGSLGNPGPTGATGSAGKDGTGVSVKGSDTEANIQAKTGAAGDMWLITDVGPKQGQGLVSDGNGSGIAHWTNVGNIAGPKGDTGPQGQPGVNGSNGADSTVAGPTGPQGPDGGQGIQGVKGDASTVAGPTGQQGIRGLKGDTGIDGPQGPIGHTGATGPQGAVGPQGPKGDSGSGTGGGGLAPEDQAKLDAIQVGPNNMTLDKNVLLVGDGTKAVGIKLHNPSTEEAIIQGDGSKGAWYVGSFPKSGVHPDDLVLSNSTGGLFTSIADGAKWSVRYGTDIVSFTKAELQAVKAGGGGTGTPGPKGDKGDAGKDGVDGKDGAKGDKGDTGPQGTPGTGGGSGLDPADKTKLDFLTVTKAADIDAIGMKTGLIDGTTGINFDEIILDGDRASVSDIDDPNAVPTTLERFVSIAGLRHGLAQFGKIMGTTYEHLLGNPIKDDQILSSKKDGTRSWIDSTGVTEARVEELIHEYRTTVDYDTAGATPTRAECKLAALQLPHFDWAVDDDFYLRQVDRTKMALVKYRALASSVDEATAGEFWLEKLTLVK